jgi:hypothetical protein
VNEIGGGFVAAARRVSGGSGEVRAFLSMHIHNFLTQVINSYYYVVLYLDHRKFFMYPGGIHRMAPRCASLCEAGAGLRA